MASDCKGAANSTRRVGTYDCHRFRAPLVAFDERRLAQIALPEAAAVPTEKVPSPPSPAVARIAASCIAVGCGGSGKRRVAGFAAAALRRSAGGAGKRLDGPGGAAHRSVVAAEGPAAVNTNESEGAAVAAVAAAAPPPEVCDDPHARSDGPAPVVQLSSPGAEDSSIGTTAHDDERGSSAATDEPLRPIRFDGSRANSPDGRATAASGGGGGGAEFSSSMVMGAPIDDAEPGPVMRLLERRGGGAGGA